MQRCWRRLKLHRKIIHAVNRKIAFNKQERYRKEMERQEKEAEAARQAANATGASADQAYAEDNSAVSMGQIDGVAPAQITT